MEVRLQVLGRPSLVPAGRAPVPVPPGNARVAYALLVLERHRPVHRDELADALWADDLPPTWWSALRTVLVRLRAALREAGLPHDAVAAEGGCYVVRLPPGATVDVDAGRSALARAAASLDARNAVAAATYAERAAATLGQPLLPGADGVWVESARQPVERDALRAYELLAAARALAGDWTRAIAAADALIARDPFRESGHLRKMAAHLALGDRAGALLAYRRCRELFATELGIAPGPELAELAARAAGHRRPA